MVEWILPPPIFEFKNKSFVYPKHFYCEFTVCGTPVAIESAAFVETDMVLY